MIGRLSGLNRPNNYFNGSQLPLRENQAYHESWYYTATRIDSARCISSNNTAKVVHNNSLKA